MNIEKALEGEWTLGRLFKWILSIMIIITILGVASSFLGLLGKAATVPSRVISKTLDTNNVIQTYEWFYDTNAA